MFRRCRVCDIAHYKYLKKQEYSHLNNKIYLKSGKLRYIEKLLLQNLGVLKTREMLTKNIEQKCNWIKISNNLGTFMVNHYIFS
jgi:hypothetical protein